MLDASYRWKCEKCETWNGINAEIPRRTKCCQCGAYRFDFTNPMDVAEYARITGDNRPGWVEACVKRSVNYSLNQDTT